MILIDIWGAPGSGKSTLAAYLYYRLKKAGVRAELVGEAARESHIYNAVPGQVPPPLLDNQILLAGEQYERILRLKRHGIEVAINDSPIVQNTMYCEGQCYHDPLLATVRSVEAQLDIYRILVHRKPGHFDAESRVQRNEEETAKFDTKVLELIEDSVWMEAEWGDEALVADRVLELVL